jgi:hypothetical protein
MNQKENKQKHPSSAVIMQVYKRDKFTCVYCGVNGSEAELQCDHLHPISKGGSNHVSNLRTSCRSCNQSKGNKTNFKSNVMGNQSNSVYFFTLNNYWYKTESNLLDSILLVTVIDPYGYEYETIRMEISETKAVKFYSNFYTFLEAQDERRWRDGTVDVRDFYIQHYVSSKYYNKEK